MLGMKRENLKVKHLLNTQNQNPAGVAAATFLMVMSADTKEYF